MAGNTNPIFPEVGIIGNAQISTANTNRDGSGTIADVVTAGVDGSRVNEIEVRATGTTTAGMIRLFIHNGSAYRLWREIPVGAVTPSDTVEAWSDFIIPRTPLVIPNGYKLAAATHNAETFNVFAHGGDY